MRTLTNIILFIVIAFCSCKEKKPENYLFHPLPIPITGSDTLSINQFVYASDNNYVLSTTIETPEYRSYKESSHIFPLSEAYTPKCLYSNTILGNYTFILDNKKRQYQIADSLMKYLSIGYYKKQKEIKELMEKERLIKDSVKLLNSIK